MMKERDILHMMYELEKNGVNMKEELKEAAKELPEMVKETLPFPYSFAASQRTAISSTLITPLTVSTRAEKQSVPRLRRKPSPLTRLISASVNMMKYLQNAL